MESNDTKQATKIRLPPEKSGQVAAREQVPIAKLVTDAGTQIRQELNDATISEYAEALEEGARFPPVVIFRAKGADLLADGFHRIQAYRRAGRSEIEADVYQGGRDEALWFALGANRAHGQRLSGGDKRRAIEIAYQAWPDISQVRIAAQVGCTPPYVGQVRAQLKTSFKLPEQVVGKDGRRRAATRRSRSQPSESTEETGSARQDQEPGSGTEAHKGAQEKTSAESPENTTESAAADPGPSPGKPASSTETEPGRAERRETRPGASITTSQTARDRSNRIVSVVAYDAKNLTAQEYLIDFTALDAEQVPKWIEDLEEARRMLGRFIRRLRQEVEDEVRSTAPD